MLEIASVNEVLHEILAERIMVLDGSMGALLYSKGLHEEDYRGKRLARHPVPLKNCTEALLLSQPELIAELHRTYLEAGADIIETDTFNANRLSLEEFGLEEHVVEMNRVAVELARREADAFLRRDPDRPRFVAGSIGPTKKQLSMGIHVEDPGRRDVTYDQMVVNYYEQVRALVEAGVDILLPETSFDTLVLKACLFAISQYFQDSGNVVPVMISGTIFDNGRTLSMQPVEAFYHSVSHFDSLSVGLNCAVGVDLMRGAIESLASIARTHVSCYPNAGLPDGFGGFLGDRDHTAAVLGEFARNGWLNLVGGCCGTTPDWIAAIAKAVEGVAPRKPPTAFAPTAYAGNEPLVILPDTNFLMVGERTNITGSRKFARLIRENKYEEALSIAREQVENGANIIDVNMDEGLIDGPAAMTRFLNLVSAEPSAQLAGSVKLFDPDSSDGHVVLRLRNVPDAPAGHHYEVWVLRPGEGAEMEAIGAFTPTDGRASLTLPLPGPGEYVALDISIQENAGPPEHSGTSLGGAKLAG